MIRWPACSRFVGLLLLLSVGCVAPPVTPVPWPHEGTDLAPSPRIQFGALENGLRFAWIENAEPDRRSYLRLHVDVGAFDEEDHEQGMAHFLEHMAFNGTDHFPAGTINDWFQEHGMQSGSHTNAETGRESTTYRLDLPESDPDSLREGLLVLRDFAGGQLLLPEEIEKEKGVIDGEQQFRDDVWSRVRRSLDKQMLNGTRYVTRDIIGTEEIRSAFTADTMRSFYERWYRPERMTLVLAGDLDGFDPAPMIQELFADLESAGDVLPEHPPIGEAEPLPKSFLVVEDEIPSTFLVLERRRPWEDEELSRATLTEDIPLVIALSLLNRRLSLHQLKEDCPFLSAGAGPDEIEALYEGAMLKLECEPDRWQEALEVVVVELRRAMEHGFEEAELKFMRLNILRSLDESVEREATQSSRAWASRLMEAIDSEEVPMDAATIRSLIAPAIEAVDVEICREALIEFWGEGDQVVYGVGTLALGESGEAQLEQALAEAWSAPLEAAEALSEVAFAYASDPGDAGEIVRHEHVEDLDLHLYEFANGVRLNLKVTDFKEKQILMYVRIGEGCLSLAPEDQARADVARASIGRMGLGAHDIEELQRLLAGRVVRVSLGILEDSFVVQGSCSPEDILLQCELTGAFIEDSGWREDGLHGYRRSLPTYFDGLSHQLDGPLKLEFDEEVFSGDPRWSHASEEELRAVGMEEVRSWIAPQLNDGAIEVSFVGDLELDATVEACRRTFGALPKRRAREAHSDRLKAGPVRGGLERRYTIDSDDDRALVLIRFPTTDGIDRERGHGLNLLGLVLDDRIQKQIREELGLSYSPQVGATHSTTYPGLGFMDISMTADPEETDIVREACLKVAADLAQGGVEAGELERVRAPVLKQLRDMQRSNRVWLDLLSEAQTDPDRLGRYRRLEETLLGISPEALSALAAEYLLPERASSAVVIPE